MAFNKKELDQCFKSVTVEGFKFSKEIMGYSWTKENSDKKKQVIIGYAGYPDLYRIYTPAVEIYFNDVEEIITKFLEKHQIQNHFGNTTIQKSFVELNNVDYSKFQLRINNEASFNTVVEEIKKVLNFGVMPFFEKYNSLSQVAELFADKTPEKIVPYIQGSILFPKTILILKLAKHPSFMNKLKEYYDILLKRSEEKEIDRQMFTIYKDLFFEEIKEFCSV